MRTHPSELYRSLPRAWLSSSKAEETGDENQRRARESARPDGDHAQHGADHRSASGVVDDVCVLTGGLVMDMRLATEACNDPTRDAVRQMNAEQFAQLGLQQVAYLTSGESVGGRAVAIHAANGHLLAVVDDIDDAVQIICQNDLMLVRVH